MKFELARSIDFLGRTPQLLKTFIQDLPEDWVHATEGPDTWSAYDVIGHLIQGELNDWIPRAEIMLSDSVDKNFTPFDRFAQFELSKGKSLTQLLDEFALLRQKNLEILKSWNLTEADYSKTGIHPEFVKVTLEQLLATWVTHDLGHIAQISRVLAKQYKEAAGPWTAYISVLNR